MMEVALRVTRRLAEEASAPEYQALIKVRRRPKDRMAMVTPRIVRAVRSLWRKAFLRSSLRMYIVQDTFVEISDGMRLFCRPRVVGHHDNSLTRFTIESIHQIEDFLRRYPVEVSGRLIGNQDGWVGDNGAGNGDALLLPSGELTRIMIHSTCKVDDLKCQLHVRAPLSARKTGE